MRTIRRGCSCGCARSARRTITTPRLGRSAWMPRARAAAGPVKSSGATRRSTARSPHRGGPTSSVGDAQQPPAIGVGQPPDRGSAQLRVVCIVGPRSRYDDPGTWVRLCSYQAVGQQREGPAKGCANTPRPAPIWVAASFSSGRSALAASRAPRGLRALRWLGEHRLRGCASTTPCRWSPQGEEQAAAGAADDTLDTSNSPHVGFLTPPPKNLYGLRRRKSHPGPRPSAESPPSVDHRVVETVPDAVTQPREVDPARNGARASSRPWRWMHR